MPLVEAIVDLLDVLCSVRRERDVYREIGLCAIHRLHHQRVELARQRSRILWLSGELQRLRRQTRRTHRADHTDPSSSIAKTQLASSHELTRHA